MLKGISPLLPPDLLKIMMEMGHGDTIVIGDGNFPAASVARRLVRCDGHRGTEIAAAMLALFPLDRPQNQPAAVMATEDGSLPPIWNEYLQIMKRQDYQPELTQIERFAFYEEARKAYAVVATGEMALYANLILKKGVIAQGPACERKTNHE
ncbi:MAG: RbsD/FucU domain-containing protein [Eubacteriales bacterium]|nr:RbsD/FucU domain-containing protein [Eubacteriales bacterium]